MRDCRACYTGEKRMYISLFRFAKRLLAKRRGTKLGGTFMPRDLPLGNGKLLLNFDKSYNLRDIYWPHVGQELHTAGDISHTGVWVDGQFAWLDAPEWQREMVYEA